MITADYKGALQYLTKALEMSKEGGDLYQEGLAYYRLGGAYEKGGEVDSALKCYRSYFERCKHHGDARGMGQACQALANTYEK
jgi:tetratricopeptide (TPR) repeat protein